MAQITVEERRRIRLNKQRASLDFIRQLSAPLPLSKPPATRPQFRRAWHIALIAALLTAGWFLSPVVELHPPRSIADMAPRLDPPHQHDTVR
jgi:hypothetical protein